MKYYQQFEDRHPFLWFLGFFILIVLLGLGLFRVFKLLIHISWVFWVVGGILSGIFISFMNGKAKHVRPTIWSMITNIGASTAFIWLFGVSEQSWWMKCIIGFLLLPIYLLANRALKYDLEQDTIRRTRRATWIVDQVLSKNGEASPKFGLYLRPFITTEHLPAQTLQSERNLPMDHDNRADHLDLETIFRRAFDKEIDLIAPGNPENIAEGLARVSVGTEEWQDRVRQLMDKATFIMMVPLKREGTLWELRELKTRGHLGKTIFLMPEMQSEQINGIWAPVEKDRVWDAGLRIYNPSEHYLDIFSGWQQVHEYLNTDGIFLPPYSPSGALFTLSPDTGHVMKIVPLLLSFLIHRDDYLRKVFIEFGLIPWRAKSNIDLLKVFEESTTPSIKNREFVLTRAFVLFAMLGDVETASIILQRINSIDPGRPLLINQMIEYECSLYTDPKYDKYLSLNFDYVHNYLTALRNYDGMNTVVIDEAISTLNSVAKKSSITKQS